MERIKSLKLYPKILLLLLGVMIVGFAAVYSVTINRVGFKYKDEILVPVQENGNTTYSGKIEGQPACFVIDADDTVRFQHGYKTYGPYTFKEDPTAVPKDHERADSMVGVEVRCGGEILFRGGLWDLGDRRLLYNEDGSDSNIHVVVTMSDGTQTDADGNVIDPMEPSAYTIMELLSDPEMVHKGNWMGWLLGIVCCGFTAISILFADELFRWQFLFSVRDPDRIEPSNFELATRPVGWTLLTMFTLCVFIWGCTM